VHTYTTTKRPRPTAEGNIRSGETVTLGAHPPRPNDSIRTVSILSTSTGIIIAVEKSFPQTSFPPPVTQPNVPSQQARDLPFDEEAKLVYGLYTEHGQKDFGQVGCETLLPLM
jgi:hypothetical protein